MGAAAEFDIGPLTWVKGEIEQALAKAGEALDAQLAEAGGSTHLKMCRTHLHQAHGALEIVGLDGLTHLTENSEALLLRLEAGEVVFDQAVAAALKEAFVALTEYLNELVEGAPHQPVRLFPAYRRVMQVSGAERIAESDLFFPDLSVRPPKREVTDLPADMKEHVLSQRRRFQGGLLRWLRNHGDSAALKDMLESVRAIERTQALPQHRAFWWITIGFTETLQDAGDAAPLEAKRLCARIDLQMKRLMEGSQNVAERLMRDALYFVAKSRADTGSVKELRKFYQLEGSVPEKIQDKTQADPHEIHLRTIREILAGAKDKWNKFSAGQAHELSGFRDQASLLKEKTAALGHPEFARLANAISTVTVWISENPGSVTESIALETATALLLAENAADNFFRLNAEFTAQVEAMGVRLKASLAGQASDVADVPLLDEMTRKAQERLLMAQVVSEIKSNLGGIETTLDGFFRDAEKRTELPALDTQIRQVLGALTILGSDKAVAALAACQTDIARFAQADYASAAEDFEKVAQVMSALGFYVEALQHGAPDFDQIMHPAAPGGRGSAGGAEDDGSGAGSTSGMEDGADALAKKSAEPREAPTQTVEAELEQEKRDARAIFDAWRLLPQDAMLSAELKASLEAVKSDADLVDDPALRKLAVQALGSLGRSDDAAALVDLDKVMAKIAPPGAKPAMAPAVATPEPVAALVVEEAPPLPEEAVDAELLAIFLEEAEEVLQTISEHVAKVRVDPGHKETLTTIRRGFHTLKGSGRMVGLMRFGEAAWSIEQTMNQWLQEAKPVNATLLDLIDTAQALFVRWVSELVSEGSSSLDGRALIAAAQQVQAGAAPVLAAASTAVASPAAVVAQPVALTEPPVAQVPAAPVIEEPPQPVTLLIEEAAPAASAAALPAETPTPVPAAPFDKTIVIGDIRVSPVLYNIFVDEAGSHLATMRWELAALAEEPQPPRDEFVRAAHTLAGIAGTVNFSKLNQLGRAFELMLVSAKGTSLPLTEADATLSMRSVEAMEAMVAAVRELREPPLHPELQKLLEARRAELSSAAEEAPEPMLASFELPVVASIEAIPTASALSSDEARAAAESAGAPEAVADGLQIDFGALADRVRDQAEPAPVQAPSSDFTLDIGSLAAAPLEMPVPEAKEEPVDPDDSFNIERLALPPAEAAPAPVLDEAPAPLAFIDAVAPATSAPIAAAIPDPVLGDRTILAAATGALATAAFEQLARRDADPVAASAEAQKPANVPLSDEELQARGFDTSERRQERLDDDIDEQLLPIFMEEANELMPRIGEELRAWAEGGDAKALQRSLHTLKGSARMAGAMALGQLTHSMETRVENALGLPQIPPAIFEGLFSSYDRTTMLMERLRNYDPADKAGMAKVSREAISEDDASKLVSAFDAAAPMAEAGPAQVQAATASGKAAEDAKAMLRVRADVIDRLVNEAGEVAIARTRIEGEMRAVKVSLKDLTDNLIKLRAQLREVEIAAETQMQSRRREVEEKHDAFDPLEFDRFSRLQEITRSMAESVNDVATVQQNLLRNLDEADAALIAQSRLSRDLQNDLMRVRMVPFNNVAERLYRVVRQTAKELGKRANLDIKGTQTEIDRSVLERMTGPFEHLLRNAIAHGLEAPQARAAAGKEEIGQIGLSARQEGNEFVLVFEDDGQGLNVARIRAKAVANGLMQEGDALLDQQVAEFIFAAGFSTAAEVSEVSGRGVGMDVVRAEVTALGGRVEVDFTPGKGSRFTIYLPLTLAVTQVVLIRAASRTFAVPAAMVEQVRQIKADELERSYAAGQVDWLGRSYPLNYLPRLLGDEGQAAELQRFTPILLLRSGTQRAAIHVDEMLGNQEAVVKNIGPQLARVSGIAGATVLGSGQIILILNPVSLSLMTATAAAVVPASVAPIIAAPMPVSTRPTVMVVDDSLTVRKITSRLLAREDYQVLTAKDGIDALEQLAELRPDVMLVDVEMPRMDGFDLTRNVRGHDKLKRIPIIMITSRTADKHRNYAMEVGVNVFLGKPYQEEELLEHIAYLVRNRSDVTVTA